MTKTTDEKGPHPLFGQLPKVNLPLVMMIIIMLMVVLIKETEDNRGEIVTGWDEQKPPTHNGNPTTRMQQNYVCLCIEKCQYSCKSKDIDSCKDFFLKLVSVSSPKTLCGRLKVWLGVRGRGIQCSGLTERRKARKYNCENIKRGVCKERRAKYLSADTHYFEKVIRDAPR